MSKGQMQAAAKQKAYCELREQNSSCRKQRLTPTGQEDMNTEMKELTLDQMDMVNGGIDWDWVLRGGWAGGTAGLAVAGVVVAACTGPVGWAALAGVAGATVVGAAAGAGIGAGASEIFEDV